MAKKPPKNVLALIAKHEAQLKKNKKPKVIPAATLFSRILMRGKKPWQR